MLKGQIMHTVDKQMKKNILKLERNSSLKASLKKQNYSIKSTYIIHSQITLYVSQTLIPLNFIFGQGLFNCVGTYICLSTLTLQITQTHLLIIYTIYYNNLSQSYFATTKNFSHPYLKKTFRILGVGLLCIQPCWAYLTITEPNLI